MTHAKNQRTGKSNRGKSQRNTPSSFRSTNEREPVAGILEVLPVGYGFLRRGEVDFESSTHDVYVSQSMVDRFRLATGCQIEGIARNPSNRASRKDRNGRRLQEIVTVNALSPDDFSNRPLFETLTARQPQQRLHLELAGDMSLRVVDLVTPIGKGQRGLIVSPPRAGKTVLLQKMAASILQNQPDCHVMILLIDERPEEVTDVRLMVADQRCEVISSTFDQTPANHARVAKLVLGRAKRLVECGRDVVVLLDSITRLTRAHNTLAPAGCKITTGGLAMEALVAPKEFLGAARKLGEGGSLTILATALVDTGTRMDQFIFEEFKGTGNMEIHLSRQMVERRVWPAIDIMASSTRREELLMDADELRRVSLLRRALSRVEAADAMEMLTERLSKTRSNAEFLLSMSIPS